MDSRIKGDTLIMTNFDEKPKVDQYRDTRIEYTEALGNSRKTLDVETYITFDELRELCKTLMGVGE